MKKILLTTVLLLSVSLITLAQNRRERPSPEDMAKRNTEWMTKELSLTEDQIVLVDSVNLVFAKAQQRIFEEIGENFEGVRETMQALEEEKVKAFSEVLSEDQLELYKKKRDEMRQNRRGRRGGNS